jgi:integrase
MVGVLGAEQTLPAPRWLDDQEFRRVMRQLEINCNAAKTQLGKERAVRDMAIVHLMVFAGLRVGEVVALQHGDIEIGERHGKVIIRLGKGGKYGEVPLANEVRRSVANWLALNLDDGFLFPVTSRAVEWIVADLGTQAHVDGLTPHRFRHTFVKRMLDAGRTLPEAQALARHKSGAMTMRYGMPGRRDLEAAVESILAG